MPSPRTSPRFCSLHSAASATPYAAGPSARESKTRASRGEEGASRASTSASARRATRTEAARTEMFVRKYETRRARRLSRRRSASRVSASVLVREDAGRYARSSMSTSHHAVDALGGGSNADASFVFFIFSGRSRAFFRDVVAEIRSTRRRGARTAALLARLARRRATRRPAPGLERRLERGEVELEIRELRLERRASSKKKTPRARLLFGSSRVRLRVLPGGERRKRVPGDIQPRRGRRVRVHPRVLPARRRRGEERRRRRAPRVRLRHPSFRFRRSKDAPAAAAAAARRPSSGTTFGAASATRACVAVACVFACLWLWLWFVPFANASSNSRDASRAGDSSPCGFVFFSSLREPSRGVFADGATARDPRGAATGVTGSGGAARSRVSARIGREGEVRRGSAREQSRVRASRAASSRAASSLYF